LAAQPRWLVTWPILLALAVAALWPLTAYAVSPILLPGVIVLVTIAAVVAWRPEYGIALALALAPWTNMVLQGNAGDPLRIPGKPFHLVLPALGFGLVAYSMLVSRPDRSAVRSPVLTVAVLFFVAAALASSMQALKPSSSVTKVFLLLTAAALFFAVTQVCRERRQLLVVVTGALIGLLLASAQGILQHYTGSFGQFGFVADGGTVVKRVQGSFGHPNQYGGFIAALIPLAVAALATRRRLPASTRWIAGIALSLSLFALIFSYARGAIAAVVIGSLLWLAFQRPRIAVVAALVVAVGAFAFAPAALRQRFNPQGVSGDVPLRADIWSSALDIYSDHPVLGVGVDNFSVAYADLPATSSRASQRRLLHQDQLLTPPHAQNQYLNIMAEEGLVGLASLVLLGFAAVAVISRGARVRDPVGRTICLGIGAGVMTLAVHSFLEAELLGEVALPLFALVAVAAGFVSLDSGEPE
jgi:O-antigen ligase